jgi:hypothetical protein
MAAGGRKFLEKANRIGLVTTLVIYSLYILMFLFRLLGMSDLGYSVAAFQFVFALPLIYLLLKARQLDRPALYTVQVCLMLFFLLVEFFLDYYFQIEFRQIRWAAILYITLFCASTGGLLGLTVYAENRTWRVLAIILFFVMVALAFVQRAITGM